MKFVLLVTVCVLGTVWCETHDQQMKFADRLIGDIEDAVDGTNEMLKTYDETTGEARMLLSMHANALNFNLHFILDCLQYVVIRNKDQPRTLQEIVFKLNQIAFELEDSFKHGVGMVKRQFQRSVENVMVEAKNMRRIIQESDDHSYRTIVLRYLDDLTTSAQGPVSRNELRRQPKAAVKSLIRIARKILTSTLDSINSSLPNVQKDIVRYSSEFSSVISETKNMLRDLASSFETRKADEVKEIIYSLSKMVRDNDEVLHSNGNSLQEVKDQFRVTIVNLTEQLNKLVDAGYSDDQTMEDENLIYAVLSGVLNEGNSLQRNFEKTIANYITPRNSSE